MAEDKPHKRVVLIAMDGSEFSDYALDWYTDNVHRDDDRVILVHCPEYHSVIHQSPFMADAAVWSDLMLDEEKKNKDFVERLGEKLKKHGFGGKVKSVGGEPGEVIINAANEENADLIVTGCRGMGRFRRTFVGSVSDYVLHHSHIPVLTCKHIDHGHHGHHHSHDKKDKKDKH